MPIESLPPPPRKVSRRPNTSGLPDWTALVLLPFAVVGIAMLIAIPFHLSFLPKPGVIVVFDLLIGIFLGFVQIPLMQEKKVVQTGIATPGNILDSASYRQKTTMYAVTFAFKTSDGTELQKRAVVSAVAFEKVTAGQAVTVLYDPASPQNAVIYECCQYQVTD
jgi:hypothetical protein